MSHRSWLALCLVIAALGLGLRLSVINVDPDWSRRYDLAVEVDMGLYACSALNAAQGVELPGARSEHHEVSLHSLSLRAGLAIFKGLPGARLPGIFLGLLSLLAVAYAAKALAGWPAACLATALVASSPLLFDADLGASPYSLVLCISSLGMAAQASSLRAKGVGAQVALALVVPLISAMLAGALLPAGLITAPGFFLGGLLILASHRDDASWRRRLGLIAALSVLAGLVLLGLSPRLRSVATKHMGALDPLSLSRSVLSFGQRAGLVTFSAGLFALWPTALWAAFGVPDRRRRSALLALNLLAGSILAYDSLLTYDPVRYVLPMLAAITVCVAAGLLLPSSDEPRSLTARFCTGLLALVVIHQLIFSLIVLALWLGGPRWLSVVPNSMVHGLTDGACLASAWFFWLSTEKRAVPWAGVLAVALNLTLLLPGIAVPSHLLTNQARRVDEILPGKARLAESLGPSFALLTGRSAARNFGTDPILLERARERGISHLIIDEVHEARLAKYDAALIPLWRGRLERSGYLVARLRQSCKEIPPTELESVFIDLAEGRERAALGRMTELEGRDPGLAKRFGFEEIRARLRRSAVRKGD